MVTRAVSFPTPRVPPVIITTFPVWSGTLSTFQVGSGGKSWRKMLIRLGAMTGEYVGNVLAREGVEWGKGRQGGTTNDGTFYLDRWAVGPNPIIALIIIERLEEHVFATTQ